MKAETRYLFPQKAQSYMLHCVLNTPLRLVVNEVCFEEEPISIIRIKISKKSKRH